MSGSPRRWSSRSAATALRRLHSAASRKERTFDTAASNEVNPLGDSAKRVRHRGHKSEFESYRPRRPGRPRDDVGAPARGIAKAKGADRYKSQADRPPRPTMSAAWPARASPVRRSRSSSGARDWHRIRLSRAAGGVGTVNGGRRPPLLALDTTLRPASGLPCRA